MTIKCNYFDSNRCRSCGLLPIAGQAAAGQKPSSAPLPAIASALGDVCPNIHPWVRCSHPFGSRAKAKLSVTGSCENPIIGIVDRDLAGVELLKCPLHKPIINNSLALLCELISKHSLIPYSIKGRSGELKGLILQTNQAQDHLRVRFVLRTNSLRKRVEKIVEEISDLGNHQLSASINLQPIPHQIPEGPQEIHLYGEELLWEQYGSVSVGFPAQSFMQVTPEIASKLYLKASDVLSSEPNSRVLDLFCGAGGFALSAAAHAKQVLGVEISTSAIAAAKASATANNFKNCEFKSNDVDEIAEEIAKHNILICNPPRRGVGQNILSAIQTHLPETIIYSSCNVESLLSDYQQLKQIYQFVECTPFEMFPLTNHFETLSIFKKR